MRCFVALWPTAAARAALDVVALGLATQLPDARRMRSPNLHLTLAFIGDLDDARGAPIAAALESIAVEPFTWPLDRLGHFPRARVVWAGGPPESRLDALAQAVRERLDALHVPYDRKPFSAHVTLLRNAPDLREAPTLAPIEWPVGQPQLIVSTRDPAGAVTYRPWARPASH
ncbi:MAG: RNA 2',3'-cyclic phosphodiesterase [Burkholderiaceae bacterium]